MTAQESALVKALVARALELYNKFDKSDGEDHPIVELSYDPAVTPVVRKAVESQLAEHGFSVQWKDASNIEVSLPPEWSELPKFMVADPGGNADSEHTGYILHTHYPRFLLKIDDETGRSTPLFFDNPAIASDFTDLCTLALEFYNEQMGLEE